MATTDITHVKELGRVRLTGGQSNVGIASTSKVMCWGEIQGTYGVAGLALNKVGGLFALGVKSVDYCAMEAKKTGAAGAINPTTDKTFLVNFVPSTGKIFVVDEVGAADPTTPEITDTIVINYLVIGNDSRGVELV